MSIIEKAAKAIIKGKIETAILPVMESTAEKLEKASKAIDDYYYDKGNKYQNSFTTKLGKKAIEDSNSNYLFIKKNQKSWTDNLEVYDSNQEFLFHAKGALTSIKRHIYVYDSEGNELGAVKEKIVSVRSPLSLEGQLGSPFDCDLEISGKKIGRLSSEFAVAKRRYHLEPYGFKIEGNLIGGNLKVYDKENHLIINMPDRDIIHGFYAISYTDPKYRFIALLIILAIIIDFESSKAEEARSNIKKKEREIKRTLRKL